MDLAGTFIREVITLAGYVMVFAAVYKIVQIATDLGEIKDLLRRGQTLASVTQGTDGLADEEAYAAKLLKSVRSGQESA